uniref:RING-type domain-containing protein n=2 Tax=Musa acuminata subsp. malaccensis TaxID=214687 RepID=A0A804JYZ3_MUSAM
FHPAKISRLIVQTKGLQSPAAVGSGRSNSEHHSPRRLFGEGSVRERLKLLGEFLGTPPTAANGTRQHATRNNGGGTASFDTNMVFILAALLCALVFALGLNSVVRCALRCGRRVVFENPEEVSSRLAATGLKKRSLRRIPVAVYGSGADFPATECPICLGEFADGEKVRVLPRCHHGFHVRCIDKWLASHSSCPTCRQSLLDHGGGDGVGGHVMESPHP